MRMYDLPIGASFIFNGENFTKENDKGVLFCICNCKDEDGEWCHINVNSEVVPVEEN